jgi:hypothetical protein
MKEHEDASVMNCVTAGTTSPERETWVDVGLFFEGLIGPKSDLG